MSVVSNAGPLIALGTINQLHLLHVLYESVLIPPTVLIETTRRDNEIARQIKTSTWLQVRAPQDNAEVERLRFWLDAGESEALVLARELGATLLIDERRGRTIAETYNVPITGTVGILIAAKQNGNLETITPLLDEMMRTGVRLSQRLYNTARKIVGESQELG
ncbi:MAG: DUF3368 domain-containing protein [Chloroflexi bacterium]|nr:DUF3368 domain-containing protein [Chloroflexota bacterium]